MSANDSFHDGLISCPLCGSHQSTPIYVVDEHHRSDLRSSIRIVKCTSCSVVYLSSPDHSFQSDLYEYYSEHMLCTHSSPNAASLNSISYLRVLRKLQKYTSSSISSILDVGCGDGSFVEVCIKHGFNCQGIDLSASAVSLAQARRLPVTLTSAFDSNFNSKTFDLITLFEVIEHVDEPLKLIDRLASLLSDSGLLYLTTPNYSSVERFILQSKWPVFHSEHITYFTSYQMRRLIQKHFPTLELVHCSTRNIDIVSIFKVFSARSTNSLPITSANQATQSLRKLIYYNPFLRLAKLIVDIFLHFFLIGSTTVIVAKKRSSSSG